LRWATSAGGASRHLRQRLVCHIDFLVSSFNSALGDVSSRGSGCVVQNRVFAVPLGAVGCPLVPSDVLARTLVLLAVGVAAVLVVAECLLLRTPPNQLRHRSAYVDPGEQATSRTFGPHVPFSSFQRRDRDSRSASWRGPSCAVQTVTHGSPCSSPKNASSATL
jgi:hypothetical protein